MILEQEIRVCSAAEIVGVTEKREDSESKTRQRKMMQHDKLSLSGRSNIGINCLYVYIGLSSFYVDFDGPRKQLK